MSRLLDEISIDEIAPRIPWDLFQRTSDPPGLRLEYEDGRVLVSPTGRMAHNVLRDLLTAMLMSHWRARPSGELFVVAEQSCFMPEGHREYRPDLAVVTGARARVPLDPDGFTRGAPTIAIEVLSPSTEKRDLGLKARRYFEQGTTEYWTFDPRSRNAIFRRRGETWWESAAPQPDNYQTPVLPEFVLNLAELWQELDHLLGSEPPATEDP